MLTALMTVLAQKLAIGQVQTMIASNFHQLVEPVRRPQHRKLNKSRGSRREKTAAGELGRVFDLGPLSSSARNGLSLARSTSR
jgi:hypothetical protein